MPVSRRHLTAVSDDTLRLSDRIRLARSILQGRRWCPADQRNADEALAALNGDSIEDIAGRRGA